MSLMVLGAAAWRRGGTAPPGSSHRYWWITISANDGSGDYTGFTKIEMRDGSDVNMIVAETGPVGTKALASSEVNGDNAAWMATNSTLSVGWLSAVPAGQWWRYDFTTPVDVRKIVIRGSHNVPNAAPRNFQIRWSDTDSLPAGNDVLSVTGQTGWGGASDIRTFNVP